MSRLAAPQEKGPHIGGAKGVAEGSSGDVGLPHNHVLPCHLVAHDAKRKHVLKIRTRRLLPNYHVKRLAPDAAPVVPLPAPFEAAGQPRLPKLATYSQSHVRPDGLSVGSHQV